MIPWIVGAAVLVLAYLVYTASRGRGGATARPPVLETWIVIDPGPTGPVVRDPAPLCGRKNDRLLWHVVNNTGRPVDVSLPHFKLHGNPNDPLKGSPGARRNHPNPDEIHDKIKENPERGIYKYDIWVDNVMRLDPDLEVIL
jgi:hypothetical protein